MLFIKATEALRLRQPSLVSASPPLTAPTRLTREQSTSPTKDNAMPTLITSSGITFDNATTLTTGVIPTANIANSAVTAAKLQNGCVVQTQQAVNAAYSSINAVIAKNDTLPTNTSGTEILSQAITPSASSNKVLVTFSAWATASTLIFPVAIILRGSTVIQAVAGHLSTQERVIFTTQILDSPSTTDSTTYSVRIGVDTGTIYINGSGSAREYGGASRATLTVQEIKA